MIVSCLLNNVCEMFYAKKENRCMCQRLQNFSTGLIFLLNQELSFHSEPNSTFVSEVHMFVAPELWMVDVCGCPLILFYYADLRFQNRKYRVNRRCCVSSTDNTKQAFVFSANPAVHMIRIPPDIFASDTGITKSVAWRLKNITAYHMF